ncbi:glycosyltransferase [Hyphobacterium sp.]|uniref:glycosyltransferase n=1 Tax=Hyphobacterium sp. TaxID=2004662 RepID=UPI003BABAA1F
MRAVERLAPHRLAADLADRAANQLTRLHPDASARSGVTANQCRAVGLIAVTSAICALADPGSAWIIVQMLAAVIFVLLIFIRLIAAILPPRWAPVAEVSESELPVVTILAPVFRETAILDQLMRALVAIDYPPRLLDIKIVLEADDRDTIAAARELAFDSRFELILVPPGTPRTKPRALNYALLFARGDIVTIYDAEDVPHPSQIRSAVGAFAAADGLLGCVQAPLNWYNHQHNALTRQFALEYAVHFHAVLPLLARWGIALPLGGTSNHIRRSALDAAGGWDAWNVTEDADLGFRLAGLGFRCDVIAPPTLEEAPETIGRWTAQRSRWLKGYLQTMAVHLRRPRQLPPSATLGLCLTLGAAIMSAVLHIPAVFWSLLLAIGGASGSPGAALGLLACGYAANMVCCAVAIRRAGLRTRGTDLLRLPLYWPLQTFAAIIAMAELKFRPFFWAKTEHGFSRAEGPQCLSPSPLSSRSSRLRPSSSAHFAHAVNRTRKKVRA